MVYIFTYPDIIYNNKPNLYCIKHLYRGTQTYMVALSIGIRGRSSVVESGRLVLEKL